MRKNRKWDPTSEASTLFPSFPVSAVQQPQGTVASVWICVSDPGAESPPLLPLTSQLMAACSFSLVYLWNCWWDGVWTSGMCVKAHFGPRSITSRVAGSFMNSLPHMEWLEVYIPSSPGFKNREESTSLSPSFVDLNKSQDINVLGSRAVGREYCQQAHAFHACCLTQTWWLSVFSILFCLRFSFLIYTIN